jgi:drug/metabolite transporter (DMT)-like permease
VQRNSAVLPYLVLFAGQLAVGSAALLARLGLDAGMNSLALSAWRLTVASVLLLALSPFNRKQNAATPLDSRTKLRLIVAGLCLGLHFATWFASLKLISIARSTLLVTTAPVWTGLAQRFLFKKQLSPLFWLGLAIAGVGVYLITLQNTPLIAIGHGGRPSLPGDLLAIAGAIAVTGYLLLVEEIQPVLGTSRTVAWTYSAAAVGLVLTSLLTLPVQSMIPHNSAAWLSILGLALIPQLIGHTSLNWCLRYFKAAVVAAATLLEPVFAGALAWLILAEPLSTRQIAGAIILLLGVALTLFERRKQANPEPLADP